VSARTNPQELPVCIVCEGCADAIFGRPASQDPYASDFQPAHDALAFGHSKGLWFLQVSGVDEARRWLRQAA
jgi:hypothetical protein